jgi:hypothetical protein
MPRLVRLTVLVNPTCLVRARGEYQAGPGCGMHGWMCAPTALSKVDGNAPSDNCLTMFEGRNRTEVRHVEVLEWVFWTVFRLQEQAPSLYVSQYGASKFGNHLMQSIHQAV